MKAGKKKDTLGLEIAAGVVGICLIAVAALGTLFMEQDLWYFDDALILGVLLNILLSIISFLERHYVLAVLLLVLAVSLAVFAGISVGGIG